MIEDSITEYNLKYEGFFNSSHFIYGFDLKEELHGHNYVVTFRIKSPHSFINEKFKAKVDLICSEMNNRVLIAKNCPTLTTHLSSSTVLINLPNNTHYQFPLHCCYIMEEINSTAECIARYFFTASQADLDPNWTKAMVIVAEIYQQQEAIFRVVNSS